MPPSSTETDSSITSERALPHWAFSGRTPLTLVDGDGAWVTDDEGNEYLDFMSQLYCVNAGHGNERINEAIEKQLGRISYVASARHNDVRSRLAHRIVDKSPFQDAGVFFSVSGSEANEAALQLTRTYMDAPKVLTRWRSYHGSTYGASSLTGDPGTRGYVERYAATTGAGKFLPPLPECFDADSPDEVADLAADHLEWVIRNEGPENIAGILTEVVAGTSGAFTAAPGYFPRVREICDEYDILLIVDEVITGFGRCGDWFGIQTEDVTPDVITFAKGVTSSYVPLGGVIASSEITDHLKETEIPFGQTFAGHPLGCAAGLAAMDEYEEHLIEHVRSLESTFQTSLREIAAKHDVIHDVRGRGFLQGIEFRDPQTSEPFTHPWVNPDADNPVDEVRKNARERGVLLGPGRPGFQTLLAPPLCTSKDEIETGLSKLDAAVGDVFG